MRTIALLMLCLLAGPLAAQDMSFRLDIDLAHTDAPAQPVAVVAELGRRFQADVGPGLRLEGEIVRSTRAARGREQLDIVLYLSRQDGAEWTVVANQRVQPFVGKRGQVTLEDVFAGEKLDGEALATRE